MKMMYVKCNSCGYEDRIETFSREEAEQRQIPNPGPPRCPKCGSTNVELRK